MKVIMPVAGKGTRLRPHTHLVPKPMLRIAGRPVIDYVMEDLQKLGTVEQIIYVTGHLKEKVEQFGDDVPLGRAGQPAELAPVYVLLASDESSYVSGARIAVTGGKPIL